MSEFRKPRRLNCFVAMPFGEKKVDGKPVDFNNVVYEKVFKHVFEGGRLDPHSVTPQRVDFMPESGFISTKMWEALAYADICLIDVSGDNPNVYYEMGVRHALHRQGSLIVRLQSDSPPPFDIKDIEIVSYSIDTPEDIDQSIKTISDKLRSKLKAWDVDSPVHLHVDNIRVRVPQQNKKSQATRTEYRMIGALDKSIGVIPGDMMDIDDVDAWVNSENTLMQMARVIDRSISGLIRYYGARKNDRNEITRDTIAIELKKKMKGARSVALGTVLDTVPGELEKQNVKRILHVASVIGTPGKGITLTDDVSACVECVLARADAYNSKATVRKSKRLKSVLFPLIGTGMANENVESVIDQLVSAAADYLAKHQKSAIEKVWFSAYTELDEGMCRRSMDTLPGLERI